VRKILFDTRLMAIRLRLAHIAQPPYRTEQVPQGVIRSASAIPTEVITESSPIFERNRLEILQGGEQAGEDRAQCLVNDSRNLLASFLKSRNRPRQVPGISEASKTQSGLIRSCLAEVDLLDLECQRFRLLQDYLRYTFRGDTGPMKRASARSYPSVLCFCFPLT
jgi:hypothetical protein